MSSFACAERRLALRVRKWLASNAMRLPTPARMNPFGRGAGLDGAVAMTMRQKLIDVLDRGPVAAGFLLRQEWAGRETGTFVQTRVPFGTPAPVGLR